MHVLLRSADGIDCVFDAAFSRPVDRSRQGVVQDTKRHELVAGNYSAINPPKLFSPAMSSPPHAVKLAVVFKCLPCFSCLHAAVVLSYSAFMKFSALTTVHDCVKCYVLTGTSRIGAHMEDIGTEIASCCGKI